MTRLAIGLTFPGIAEAAFNFYRSVFGGEFLDFIRYDHESMKDMGIPDKDKQKLAYVALQVGDTILGAGDTLEESDRSAPVPGTMMSIGVCTDTREEAVRIFNDLAAGGTITMPLEDQFWGALFGSLRDKFGVDWAVRYDFPQNQ